MKTISYILVAALSIIAAASCQKEAVPSESPVRIISASFDGVFSSKTTLDGVTPKWALGDKIMLLSSTDNQEIEVISGSGTPASGKAYIKADGKITIGTTLTGTLRAVYPSTATVATSASSDDIAITIPAIQDGNFASANICIAKEVTSGSLEFKNATAVLKFTQSTANVFKVILESAAGICGETTVTYGSPVKCTTPSTKSIRVNATAGATPIYVAVAPGSITSIAAASGTKIRTRKISAGIPTAINNLTTVCDFDAWDIQNKGVFDCDYVVIDGLKWATCNIGAASPEQYGYYFSWGNTDGHWFNGTSDGYSFSESEYEDTKGGALTEDFTPDSGNDAARVNCGGTWRMPTETEIDNLISSCTSSWVNDYNGTGISGRLLSLKTDSSVKIFFPASGIIYETSMLYVGTQGYIWSNTWYTTNDACGLYITTTFAKKNGLQRYIGRTIRPVSN